MREWEIGAVENIHGALPYIRFAPILALVGVGVNRIGKQFTKRSTSTHSLGPWSKKSSAVCERIDSDLVRSRVLGVVRCFDGLRVSVSVAQSRQPMIVAPPRQLPLASTDSWNRLPASAVSCHHDGLPSTATVSRTASNTGRSTSRGPGRLSLARSLTELRESPERRALLPAYPTAGTLTIAFGGNG